MVTARSLGDETRSEIDARQDYSCARYAFGLPDGGSTSLQVGLTREFPAEISCCLRRCSRAHVWAGGVGRPWVVFRFGGGLAGRLAKGVVSKPEGIEIRKIQEIQTC